MNNYDETYQLDLGKRNKQLLLLIKPTNFQLSEFTQQDNHFMKEMQLTPEEIRIRATEEHNGLEESLLKNQIAYKTFLQTNPDAHDCCFASDSMLAIKNSDFPTGLLVICPMYWPNRRLEKHPEIYEWFKNKLGYEHLLDLSYFEKEDKALEGKGVTLFDWESRTLYISETNRAHRDVIETLISKMSEISGKEYRYFPVESYDKVYKQAHFHTSSYMMIFSKCAIICQDVIKEPQQYEEMRKNLTASGKEVYEATYDDMMAGATLGIEFFREDGSNGILLPDLVEKDSNQQTMDFFRKHFRDIVWVSAPVLIDVGGSSVECLIQTVPL